MRHIIFSISILLFSYFSHAQSSIVKQVNVSEFQKLIKETDGILLDVRTQSEYGNGHIANAGQLNYYSLDFKRKLLLLSKEEPIYLYCNTGYRSERAAGFLVKNGYKNIYNLEHGIMDWELNNLPVIIDPNATHDINNKMEFNEYSELIRSDKLVFINFYAPWCGPCRKMMPMIDSFKVEYHQQINIVKINVDASKSLVKKLKLQGVPYLVLYKNGDLLFSKNGSILRNELLTLFNLNISGFDLNND